jgi:hypothetical protein
MKEYCMMALKMGDGDALECFEDYWKENTVKLYKALQEVEETNRSPKLTEKLLALEHDPSVMICNNKVRLFKRFENYKQCAICLEENVLN